MYKKRIVLFSLPPHPPPPLTLNIPCKRLCGLGHILEAPDKVFRQDLVYEGVNWFAAKELTLSYNIGEALLFTTCIYTVYGNFIYGPSILLFPQFILFSR